MNAQLIISHLQGIVRRVNDFGNEDALVALADLKSIKAAAEEAIGEIEETAMIEARKHPGKTFEWKGMTWTIVDGKRNYDYSGNPDWVSKKLELDAIQDRMKVAAAAQEKGILHQADADGAEVAAARVTFSKPYLKVG
jgi:hypothetical protein